MGDLSSLDLNRSLNPAPPGSVRGGIKRKMKITIKNPIAGLFSTALGPQATFIAEPFRLY